MSRLAAALSTFCSCNKAGSIPQFTKHLSQFPNDYVALIWRARAHGIVGNKAECKMDLLHAISVSSGAQKQVAQAELEYTNGNMENYVSLLQTTIRDYPNYAPAWSNLGSFCENCNQHKEALTCLTKAVEVAKANNETASPWFCWDNHAIAEIYLRQVGDIDRAEEYYRAALGSCETLTVAHMGLCQVHLARDKIAHARRRFEKAKQLNPKLIHWSNFEAFRTEVEAAKGRPTAQSQVDSVTESVANLSMGKRSQESTKYGQGRSQTASASGGKRRGGNNGGGNGSGSGSDDDDSGPGKPSLSLSVSPSLSVSLSLSLSLSQPLSC